MADNEATPQPSDRPEWLESNFTSVEAQARSYNDARAEMARAQNEARQYQEYAAQIEAERDEYAAMAAQTQQAPEPQLPFNPLAAQLEQAREQGDIQTEMAINAYMQSQISKQQMEELRAELLQQNQNSQTGPDESQTEMYALWADTVTREKVDAKYGQGAWDEMRRDAGEFLRANPYLIPDTLSPIQAADRLVMAADHVQGQRMLTASEQERNQMVQARQQRLMAQTLTGQGVPPPATTSDDDRWADIAGASLNSYSQIRRGQ